MLLIYVCLSGHASSVILNVFNIYFCCEVIFKKILLKYKRMCFLLKICVLFILMNNCTMGELQCLSSDKNGGKCQDWKQMSVLVADLVGRSVLHEKVETKSNIMTLLIRAASGVIGRGTDTIRTLIVNGLVLLTQTVLTVSDFRTAHSGINNSKFIRGSRPIDWILNNPYIKSMVDDATDESLSDQLEDLTAGMPCVQMLVCRLSIIIQNMQRWVKEHGSSNKPFWRVSEWWQVKGTAKYCAEKHSNCTKMVKFKYSS